MNNPSLEEQMIFEEILATVLQINNIHIKFISFVQQDRIYMDIKTDRAISKELMEVLLEHITVPFLHASIKKFVIYPHSYFITLLLEK